LKAGTLMAGAITTILGLLFVVAGLKPPTSYGMVFFGLVFIVFTIFALIYDISKQNKKQ